MCMEKGRERKTNVALTISNFMSEDTVPSNLLSKA